MALSCGSFYMDLFLHWIKMTYLCVTYVYFGATVLSKSYLSPEAQNEFQKRVWKKRKNWAPFDLFFAPSFHLFYSIYIQWSHPALKKRSANIKESLLCFNYIKGLLLPRHQGWKERRIFFSSCLVIVIDVLSVTRHLNTPHLPYHWEIVHVLRNDSIYAEEDRLFPLILLKIDPSGSIKLYGGNSSVAMCFLPLLTIIPTPLRALSFPYPGYDRAFVRYACFQRDLTDFQATGNRITLLQKRMNTGISCFIDSISGLFTFLLYKQVIYSFYPIWPGWPCMEISWCSATQNQTRNSMSRKKNERRNT